LSNAHARFLEFTLPVSHGCILNFICWIFWVLTCARRLSHTDSQAGGGFTCPMGMRAFCPFLFSSWCSLYMYGISLLNFICWIIWVLGVSCALTARQDLGGCFTCPVCMRAFCPFLLSSCYSLLLTLLYLLGLLGAWYSCQMSLTHRQPGRRRFYLSDVHARFIEFTLYVSHCCSLNFICWIFWVLGVSCALTARQEEVLPVQCACAPLGVHSVCISVLLTSFSVVSSGCSPAPGVYHAPPTARQEEVSPV
jgi:hypothetical protein